MRCYRWDSDGLLKGIQLHRGSALNLGVTARSGKRCWVGLHRNNPPDIQSGKLERAYPFWVTPRSGDRFLVFAKPHADHDANGRILVHVSTRHDGRGSGQGWWDAEGGETLLAGVTEAVDGAWSEGLVLLNPGGVIRMHPSRADDDLALVYPPEWEPYSESWIRHEARQLLISEGVSTK